MRNGPDAARQFLAVFKRGADLVVPFADETAKACGWYGGRAVHYDAVEAFDFFVRLQPHPAETPTPDLQATAEERSL